MELRDNDTRYTSERCVSLLAVAGMQKPERVGVDWEYQCIRVWCYPDPKVMYISTTIGEGLYDTIGAASSWSFSGHLMYGGNILSYGAGCGRWSERQCDENVDYEDE